MKRRLVRGFHALLPAVALSLAACAHAPAADTAVLQAEVMATERAFAKTMADRDFAGFTNYLADDAIFFGGAGVHRGKAEVSQAWKPLFDAPAAPFSWQPARVEVLQSGDLALSTGPVFDASGKTIAEFNSIWRHEASGRWRIVFDKGADICDCARR